MCECVLAIKYVNERVWQIRKSIQFKSLYRNPESKLIPKYTILTYAPYTMM